MLGQKHTQQQKSATSPLLQQGAQMPVDMPGCLFLKTRTSPFPNLRKRKLAIALFLRARAHPAPKGAEPRAIAGPAPPEGGSRSLPGRARTALRIKTIVQIKKK